MSTEKTREKSTDRLAELCEVVREIAHDLNSKLTIILSNTSLAYMYLEAGKDVSMIFGNLREIQAASTEASELVKQLQGANRK